MLIKLATRDIEIITQCMKIILESGEFYPEEIGTRLGVDSETLRKIYENFPQLVNTSDVDDWKKCYDFTFDDVVQAIHSSIGEVAYGGTDISDDRLKSCYGVSQSEALDVFNRWKSMETQ